MGGKLRHQAAAEHWSIGGSLSTIIIKIENNKLSCFIHTVVGTARSDTSRVPIGRVGVMSQHDTELGSLSEAGGQTK